MPQAALHPCPVPRCPALTRGGRCATHRTASAREDNQRRGTAQERGYDYRWSQVSKAHLRQYPLCGMKADDTFKGWRGECFEQRRTRAATCTDHIIPVSKQPELMFDPRNHQSLCGSCNVLKAQRHE